MPALPQASLLPRHPGTGTPRCRGSVAPPCAPTEVPDVREEPGRGARSRENSPAPCSSPALGVPSSWLCPWPCHPSPRLAPCPSLSRAGTCSCAWLPAASLPPPSPCWLEELLDYNHTVLVSLCLSLLTLWHQDLRFTAQYFALSTLGCPGSGAQTCLPWWSLTNLLSLCSEYLQFLCWSIPKQILYITGINQVKYQLFSAPIKS